MNLDTEQGMQEAMEWTTNFIGMINEGGVWAIPRSDALYQIYHKEQRVVRLTPSFDGPTERVFRKLGFDVSQEACLTDKTGD